MKEYLPLSIKFIEDFGKNFKRISLISYISSFLTFLFLSVGFSQIEASGLVIHLGKPFHKIVNGLFIFSYFRKKEIKFDRKRVSR